eukprot:1998815-Amphidinium_carterae.4
MQTLKFCYHMEQQLLSPCLCGAVCVKCATRRAARSEAHCHNGNPTLSSSREPPPYSPNINYH